LCATFSSIKSLIHRTLMAVTIVNGQRVCQYSRCFHSLLETAPRSGLQRKSCRLHQIKVVFRTLNVTVGRSNCQSEISNKLGMWTLC
jgi:hypothetical protein